MASLKGIEQTLCWQFGIWLAGREQCQGLHCLIIWRSASAFVCIVYLIYHDQQMTILCCHIVCMHFLSFHTLLLSVKAFGELCYCKKCVKRNGQHKAGNIPGFLECLRMLSWTNAWLTSNPVCLHIDSKEKSLYTIRKWLNNFMLQCYHQVHAFQWIFWKIFMPWMFTAYSNSWSLACNASRKSLWVIVISCDIFPWIVKKNNSFLFV